MKPYQNLILTVCMLCLVNVASSGFPSQKQTASQKTSQTTSQTTTTFRTPAAACLDKIPDCQVYGQGACSGDYEAWARQNCAATCGFCIPGTTQTPPCTDFLDNCESYGKTTCETAEYVSWALTNCRAYCRFCTAAQLAELDARKTTIPPELCLDKLDCGMYGDYICKDKDYAGWATTNCPLYCGFCKGIPTPPRPCVDTQPDCPLYGSDVCSNPEYTTWVKDHCAKFCGLCGPKTSAVSAAITTAFTTRTQSSAGSTPQSTTQSTTQSTVRIPTHAPTPPLPSAPPLRSNTTKILIPSLGK